MRDFQTPGYEHLELSTQVVIAAALKRGCKVEVLDQSDQFIRLTKGDQVEYVKMATMTSADSYVTSMIMGNKLVTKTILDEQGVRVPKGENYYELAKAQKSYEHWQGKQLVIKPKSTNFGEGITMLTTSFDKEIFNQALEHAFSYDKEVLLEEFIPGIECRFLVIGNEVPAVLHRVPANIVGDGKQTIKELVEIKNSDPRRGTGYKTPLELIKLGKIEQRVLAEQNLNESAIPKEGEQVWLRKNSNISTGGDSVDYTDTVDNSYKEIALKAAQAANAKICGVDMMMSNHAQPANSNNHAIIELNFNPVLYFHNFPFIGQNRHVGEHMIDLLGF